MTTIEVLKKLNVVIRGAATQARRDAQTWARNGCPQAAESLANRSMGHDDAADFVDAMIRKLEEKP